MQKLICRTDLSDDPLIFVAQFVAQQKIFRAEDYHPGLTISIPDSKFQYIVIIAIMTSNTNNKTDRSETLAQLYEVFLYKKKDIIAIQKKLGINSNANQTVVHQSKKSEDPLLIRMSCC